MQDLMPPINTPDNLFHDGDPTTGVEGTIVTATYLNNDQSATRDVQQELKNILVAAEMAPDPATSNQLITAIQAIVAEAVSTAISGQAPDVGELYFTTDATDPNVKYAGTTWEYLGEGLTLRTAKDDLSDINTVIGADTATIATTNLPSHTHTIGGSTGSSTASTMTTSSFDYGTKSSNSTGAHTHTVTGSAGDDDNGGLAGGDKNNSQDTTVTTSSSGAHTHTTAIGSHTHTGTIPAHSHTLPAATGAAGSGTAISILQKSIMVAIWVRTA